MLLDMILNGVIPLALQLAFFTLAIGSVMLLDKLYRHTIKTFFRQRRNR